MPVEEKEVEKITLPNNNHRNILLRPNEVHTCFMMLYQFTDECILVLLQWHVSVSTSVPYRGL